MPHCRPSLHRRLITFFGAIRECDASRGGRLLSRPRSIEHLESRRLLTVLRLATYNTSNRPNDSAQDALFSTVFDSIGNESVAGNTSRLAVLALQETDNAQAGDNSIQRIEDILDTLYGTTAYQHVVSSLDGGGDATGFVYDTTQVFLQSSLIVDGDFTHDVTRAEFRPVGTNGDADFFMYSAHLKAGASGGDAAERALESQLIRDDADTLGSTEHIVMAGDWNLRSSFETAYVNLTAVGPGRVDDPINRPGFWNDSAAFKDIHTQNPRSGSGGGMDDRFDIMFVGEAFDSLGGLDYVSGSYHAFGNNNTHTLNQGIETGTALNATVRSALAGASDHLPVVMDIEFASTPSNFAIVQSDGSTVVAEAGIGDSYTFALTEAPQSDVTLTVTPDDQLDLGSGPAVPVTLTFTPTDALIPQSIHVAAFDDSDPEGTHTGTIVHSLSSADDDFNGRTVPSLVVTIEDDEPVPVPSVVITEIMYNPDTNEGGSSLPEWVEVANTGNFVVDLEGWRLRDEDDQWGMFPAGTTLDPFQTLVIYDEDFATESTFRSAWRVPEEALVVGVPWGSLANSPSDTNELLELIDQSSNVMDAVNYDDSAGWPSDSPDGPSIYLSDVTADNNVGGSWSRSVLGIDEAVSASAPFSNQDLGSPGWIPVPVILQPPVVESVVINEGDAQRSSLTSVVVTFDSLVDVPDAAFSITNLGIPLGAANISVNGLLVSTVDAGTKTVSTITFGVGPNIQPRGSANSLVDGNYRLDVTASMVSARGSSTTMVSDFQFGQVAVDHFFRLFGDSNGDGKVNFSDFSSAFLPAFGSDSGSPNYVDGLDVQGDGIINFLDFSGGFLANFGSGR